MYTEESAYLAYGKLTALEKLHVSRRKRYLLEVYLPRHTHNALAPAETAVHAFGSPFQFLVLIFAKSRGGLVIADNTPHASAIDKAVFRLLVGGGCDVHRAPCMGDYTLATATVSGMQVEMDDVLFLERTIHAVERVRHEITVCQRVLRHALWMTQHKVGQFAHHVSGVYVSVAVEQHQLHGHTPE